MAKELEQLRDEVARLLADKAALEQQLSNEQRHNNTNPEPKPEICKVAVKLPTFWPDRPSLWFAQAEAQFQISGVTADNTKFNYIISQLDQRLAGEVEDIITKPPPIGQQYNKLKEELIRRLSMSEEQRVRQLISEEELGGRRPSQFLRHLRSLAGTTLTDENILRQLWTRRLPQQVQALLASQADLSLDKLSELADKVIELTGPKEIFTCTAPSNSDSVLQALVQRVEDLGKQVASLSTRSRPSRSRSHSSVSRGSRSSTPANKLCWYHKKFAAKAAKCISPCSWKQSASENSNHNQ